MTGVPRVLCLRFRTDQQYYVYDTYSNQILSTPRDLWCRLDESLQPAHASEIGPDVERSTERASGGDDESKRVELAEAQAAGFLLPVDIRSMAFGATEEHLRGLMTASIPQLSLEVTERCTARCSYCAFTYDTKRVAAARDMSLVGSGNSGR